MNDVTKRNLVNKGMDSATTEEHLPLNECSFPLCPPFTHLSVTNCTVILLVPDSTPILHITLYISCIYFIYLVLTLTLDLKSIVSDLTKILMFLDERGDKAPVWWSVNIALL